MAFMSKTGYIISIQIILLTIKRQINLLWNRERWPRRCYSILGFLDTGRCRLQWRGRAGLWSAAPSEREAFRAPDNRPSGTVSNTTKISLDASLRKSRLGLVLFCCFPLTIPVISKRRKFKMNTVAVVVLKREGTLVVSVDSVKAGKMCKNGTCGVVE